MARRGKARSEEVKAVGYIRVSTEEQAKEGVSLAAQRERIKALCRARAWPLVAVHADEGISGTREDRPGLDAALADLREDRANVLVAVELSRIARNARQILNLIHDHFRDSQQLVLVSGEVDTTTAMGKAICGFSAVLAQLERDLIAERTSQALQHKIEQGLWIGRVPFGFKEGPGGQRQDIHTWEVDREGLAAVRQIRRLRKKGVSLRAICQRLNHQGVPSPRKGQAWGPSTVLYISQNPFYDRAL